MYRALCYPAVALRSDPASRSGTLHHRVQTDMTILSKTEAQRRADAIAVFREECRRLQQEEVLAFSAEQSARIEAHHAAVLDQLAERFDVDLNPRAHQLSLGMRVVSFLGALALAAAVYFLFYRYWGLLPTSVQVIILIAASLASVVATAWIDRRDASGYFTKLAALVAFACFGLNLVMLGQIFNITPSDKALLPWAALALMLAYRCDLRLLLVAGLLCLTAFIAARAGTFSGMYWLHFGERPENFLPAAVLLFSLPSWIDQSRHPGFAASYRIFGLLVLLLPILVLANWGQISYLPLASDTIEVLYQIAGFAVSAGAIWLGARRSWNEVTHTGVVFFVLFLYTKFYDWWWHWMPKYAFFLVLALAAIVLLLVFNRLRRHLVSAEKEPSP